MSTEHMEELNDQQIVRREKMAALREQGIDPFGKRFERTANSQELKDKFAELDKEQLHELNETATIAGRLVTKRPAIVAVSFLSCNCSLSRSANLSFNSCEFAVRSKRFPKGSIPCSRSAAIFSRRTICWSFSSSICSVDMGSS